MKLMLASFVLITILIGPAPASAQDPTLISRTIRPQWDNVLCQEDVCAHAILLISRHLLSKRGAIEIDDRTRLVKLSDEVENVEMITRLAEAYRDPTTSTGPPKVKSNKKPDMIETAIRAVLDAQVAAWNRGDIEGYMDGYDRSPHIVFISGDRLTRGWQTVLERYKRSYDTRAKMGVLTFSDVEITILSKDAALVFGRWQLRSKDEPRGRFTLLFKKTKTGWRIVHDHTSSA